MWSTGTLVLCWSECKRVQLLWKVWHFLEKLNVELPYGPAIPLLDMYPQEIETRAHKTLHLNVPSSIIHSSPKVETAQCPSAAECTECG